MADCKIHIRTSAKKQAINLVKILNQPQQIYDSYRWMGDLGNSPLVIFSQKMANGLSTLW